MVSDVKAKLFVGKTCYIYKPRSEGGTIIGVCLAVGDTDWTFDTGSPGNPCYMVVPAGKYDVRTEDTDKVEGKEYARYERKTIQP